MISGHYLSSETYLFALEAKTDANDAALASGEACPPARATVRMWLVDPRRRKREQTPPAQRLCDAALTALAEEQGSGACAVRVASIAWASDERDALRRSSNSLGALARRRLGASVVICQTGFSPEALRRGCPALHEFPTLAMAAHADDGRFPALGWRAFALRRAVQRFAIVDDWLTSRLASARYASVPLGNFGSDVPRDMCDALYARLLTHNRHVWWASPAARPDIGMDSLAKSGVNVFEQELETPVVCAPGAYRTVCAELELYGLAVNSIVASGALDLIDGADGLGALGVDGESGEQQDGAGYTGHGGLPDERTADAEPFFGGAGGVADGEQDVGAAFRLLKVLVTQWPVGTQHLEIGGYSRISVRTQRLCMPPHAHDRIG